MDDVVTADGAVAADASWQAEQFEKHRPQLRAVAYRMLGSISDADDAVQEAWLKLSRANGDPINNIGAWLTTVVGRVCIDMLRARQARREDYVGTWLPEPVVAADHSDGGSNPEFEALLADSVGLALLVVLETLTPSERLAFVLHDMFAIPFEDIAPVVDRTPAATRQLASRARRRVQGSGATPDSDLATQREIVNAFLAASRAGDFDALLELLDPAVVFRIDDGKRNTGAPAFTSGAAAVARQAATDGRRFAAFCQPSIVNGAMGFVVRSPGRPIGVVGITIVNRKIVSIDLVLDPDKLRGVAR
ncbi:MAG: RNA polymerase sigma factor SigJ [Acidothermaceae bacterium]